MLLAILTDKPCPYFTGLFTRTEMRDGSNVQCPLNLPSGGRGLRPRVERSALHCTAPDGFFIPTMIKSVPEQIDSLIPSFVNLVSAVQMEIDSSDLCKQLAVGFNPAIGRWDKPVWIHQVEGTDRLVGSKYFGCVTIWPDSNIIERATVLAERLKGGML